MKIVNPSINTEARVVDQSLCVLFITNSSIYLLLMIVSLLPFTAVNASVPDEDVPYTEAEIKLTDVKGGQLLFKTETKGIYTQSLMLESEAHFTVSGMINHVRLRQSFRNDSNQWVEGIYVFPLSEKSSVNKMRMEIGDRIIEGKIHEKIKAKKIYQKAKSEGKKASLVEQERPNMFTNSVANIGPGETITVEIEYIENVRYDLGKFSVRFPMTITPRYIPGKQLSKQDDSINLNQGFGWSSNTDEVPDASRITPLLNSSLPTEGDLINPIRITASIDAGMEIADISSAYHGIEVKKNQQIYSITLSSDQVSMNQDFELAWVPKTGREPEAALFTETIDGKDYALLMLLPPQNFSETQQLAKEMIYIIDTSGSMGGVSIRQARKSLQMALTRLRPKDKFNIIEFNSSTKNHFGSTVQATDANIHRAQTVVSNLNAGGGTEMYNALLTALNTPVDENYIRQIVFITDGAVGNEAMLFSLINQQLANGRLFTVGIGSAPNSHFMRKAAQFGRGTFTYIGNLNELQQKMSDLFSKLDSPVISNLDLEYPENIDSEYYPARFPDLYRGEPLLLAIAADKLPDELVVTGKTANNNWTRTLSINSQGQNKGVGTLWAKRKIGHLMDLKVEGKPETEVRDEVIQVALTHQLMSKYTSFVAVEKKRSRPENLDLKSRAVANARPKGQTAQPFAYPKTATNSMLNILLGLLLLLVYLLVERMHKHKTRFTA